MTGEFNFGDLGTESATERTPERTTTPTQSAVKPDRKRTDWKKKYDKLQKASEDMIKKTVAENRALSKAVDDLQNEMYEKRGQYDKDMVALAQRYQFNPKKYSDLSQLLISMRVRGNRAQQETVKRIVGTTEIEKVRQYIFDILEAPYK